MTGKGLSVEGSIIGKGLSWLGAAVATVEVLEINSIHKLQVNVSGSVHTGC